MMVRFLEEKPEGPLSAASPPGLEGQGGGVVPGGPGKPFPPDSGQDYPSLLGLEGSPIGPIFCDLHRVVQHVRGGART